MFVIVTQDVQSFRSVCPVSCERTGSPGQGQNWFQWSVRHHPSGKDQEKDKDHLWQPEPGLGGKVQLVSWDRRGERVRRQGSETMHLLTLAASATTHQIASSCGSGMKTMTSSHGWSSAWRESLMTSWARASLRSGLWVERWTSGTTWVWKAPQICKMRYAR